MTLRKLLLLYDEYLYFTDSKKRYESIDDIIPGEEVD